MAYKSLFKIVSDSTVVAQALTAITSLVRRENAHLEVLCIGADQADIAYAYPGSLFVVLLHVTARAKPLAEEMQQMVTV